MTSLFLEKFALLYLIRQNIFHIYKNKQQHLYFLLKVYEDKGSYVLAIKKESYKKYISL